MSKPPKTDPPRVPPRTPPPPDNRPPNKPPQKAGTLPAPTQGHLPPAHRDPFSAAVGADEITRTGGPGPRFSAGEHRLYGRVAGAAESEAEVMARLLKAAR